MDHRELGDLTTLRSLCALSRPFAFRGVQVRVEGSTIKVWSSRYKMFLSFTPRDQYDSTHYERALNQINNILGKERG